jgi:hypothetical protein
MEKHKVTVSIPANMVLADIPSIFRRDAFVSMIAETIHKDDLDPCFIPEYDATLFRLKFSYTTLTITSPTLIEYDNITRLRVLLTAIRKMNELYDFIS